MGGGNENMMGEGNVGEDDGSRDNETEEAGMTADAQRRLRSGYGGCMMETMTRPIENFSHSIRIRLIPHVGPTYHMFLEVDRVEGL
jgi:hypothetical protein